VRTLTDAALDELHREPFLWHLQDCRTIDAEVAHWRERALAAEARIRDLEETVGELLELVAFEVDA
jgi:hypothetical protein